MSMRQMFPAQQNQQPQHLLLSCNPSRRNDQFRHFALYRNSNRSQGVEEILTEKTSFTRGIGAVAGPMHRLARITVIAKRKFTFPTLNSQGDKDVQ